MKILFVSMNNHHFKQWAQQVSGDGMELFWFDVLDQGAASSLSFLTQITDWKKGFLKKKGRSFLKKNIPSIYNWLEKKLDHSVEQAFEKALYDIQPDMVHCFEMNISGLKILSVMQKKRLPLIYSSWGTDIYDYKSIGITTFQAQEFLARVDYLITDCHRDARLANELGFTNTHLGVFPGNGGIDNHQVTLQSLKQRNQILIKGYESAIGKALNVIKALELLDAATLKPYQFLIYSADLAVKNYVQKSEFFKQLQLTIVDRGHNIPNTVLLNHMNNAVLHIANSKSDGIPNALLEAMSMGAFPIQSNPGNVTAEIIEHNKNGLLINDITNTKEIAALINYALKDHEMRSAAIKINAVTLKPYYDRAVLKTRIQSCYQKVKDQSKSL